MTGEERAQKRYFVENANDFKEISAGDTLSVKFEIKISISSKAIFSERVFQSFMDQCAREFLREVCYERNN